MSSQTPTNLPQQQAAQQQQQQSQQQQQQQTQQQQTPTSSSNLTGVMSINPSSFILRKQFNYRSKYNLVNLVRELENNLREFTKSDINVSYFTFKRSSGSSSSSSTLTRTTTSTAARGGSSGGGGGGNDDIYDDEQQFLKETLKSSYGNQQHQSYYPQPYWMYSDLHFVDEFDRDIDFANLKRTKFAKLHDAMSRSENLIITMNVEYGITSSSGGSGGGGAMPSSNSLSQSMTNPTSGNNPSGGATYNRVPSFGSSRDKEQQHQQQLQQNIVKIEYRILFYIRFSFSIYLLF